MTVERSASTTVLMYHSVCDQPAKPSFAPYVVAPSLLNDHFAALADEGVVVRSVLPTPGESSEPTVVLTFDDGYRDFYDVVLPLLQQHAMRASLFVPSAYLGGTARWLDTEGEGDRPVVDAAQLRDIAASGLVDIGAHSHSHPPLDQVDAARRRSEVRLPRLILEDLLQIPVPTFAYPFGYFNGATRREVAAAGYQLAYAVGERHAGGYDHPLAIPRWGVGPDVSASRLTELVRSAPALYDRATTATKRHVWRQIRRATRAPGVSPAPFATCESLHRTTSFPDAVQP